MHNKLILSVDAMGGANAPHAVVQAIAEVCKQRNDIKFLLFGVESDIRQELSNCPEARPHVEIRACESTISDDEQPIKALKISAGSSMRMALEAVKSGEARACVSGGNTGALMVIAKMCLGMLAGIKRPAIVSIFPNRKHGSVMLDLGANSECDPQHLLQFAMMGVCFAKAVLRRDNPSVGILNVGIEEYKGRDLDRKVSELLKGSELNYQGFIEGHDLCDGVVDVVVTDGFTGNIALKVAEGVAKTSIEYMKRGLNSDLISRLGALLSTRGLRRSLAMLDPRHYNGAMLMGLDGIVVKSHGSSDTVGFTNALKVAISLVEDGINRDIMLMMQQQNPISDLGSSIVSRIKQSFGL
jgi:glycerol-3-phosphate acyltransferase PlsX